MATEVALEQKSNIFFQELTRDAAHFLPKLFVSILVFLGFWMASILVQRIVHGLGKGFDEHKQIVINLLGQTVYTTVLAFGIITALGTLGINVSALVAGLGLTGFALGFALKDAVSNILAGVMILIYRPFAQHDQISVTGLEGIVTNIDLRYTTLENQNKTYLIPNSTLLTNPIVITQNVPKA